MSGLIIAGYYSAGIRRFHQEKADTKSIYRELVVGVLTHQTEARGHFTHCRLLNLGGPVVSDNGTGVRFESI